MKKVLAAFLLLWVSCQVAEGFRSHVDAWMEAERIENCQRDGGMPDACGAAKPAPLAESR